MDDYPSYWMWARRDLSGRTHMKSHQYYDSWEEQAFAEDSSLALGGSVWPPRSYSCSFCLREFKSAQALGGHMNVHRRDRARLKQWSSIDQSEDQSHVVGEYPSQICTLVSKDELNLMSTGRVTNPFVQEKSCNDNYSMEKSLVSPAYSFCNIGQELPPKQPFFSFISTVNSHRALASNESKFGVEEDKLVVRSNQETDHVTCKRRRIDSSLSSSSLFDTSPKTCDDQSMMGKDASSLFCFVEPKSNVRHDHSLQSELVTGAKSSSSEHLDLELRLGAVRPKVIISTGARPQLLRNMRRSFGLKMASIVTKNIEQEQ